MKHPTSYDSTPETRKRMSRVKLKRGKAETALAKALWHSGYRYRLNYRELPGSPDIAITKYRVAIFIDGEFWHGYDWARRRERLQSNRSYWLEKIQENIDRDRRNDLLLTYQEWTPVHFWEKEVKKDLEGCVKTVVDLIAEQIVQQTISEDDASEEDT